MKKNIKHDLKHFQTINKGKCDSCKTQKHLDTMVMKNQTKGLYECIDYKVDNESHTLEDYLSVMNTDDKKEIKMTAGKMKKIIRWVVG